MSSVLLGVMAVALLCVVGALWLWQRAALAQQRVTTQRFVDSRLAGSPGVSGHAAAVGGADTGRDPHRLAVAASGALAGGRAGGQAGVHSAMTGAAAGGAQAATDARRASSGVPGQASTQGEVRKGEHGIAH
ncbi:MAG TPA: hypothetical protein VL424_15525, partial [Pararobbsia sp.]|nr:hypothetical protein [Pararobbsia sp.]